MDKYSSHSAIFSMIAKISGSSSVGCMYIEPRGVIGYHKAPAQQLFLVVEGEGWVCGDDENRVSVRSGTGIFWDKGEGHKSGSELGMTAIILQSNLLDPGRFMKAKE